MRLREDVFLVLVTIVAADGIVTDDERSALLQAAKAAGLDDVSLDNVSRAMDAKKGGPVPETLTLEERLFVYGASSWLSAIDGAVAPEESAALADLGVRLKLDPFERSVALASAAGSGSDQRDVSALARLIAEHQRAGGEP